MIKSVSSKNKVQAVRKSNSKSNGKSNNKSNSKTNSRSKINSKSITIALSLIAVIIIGIIVIKFASGSSDTDGGKTGGDLVIQKSEITETAKFYPYKAGKIKMEVIAVKASDETIRTAFNTCQVCYDSGRGYYEQEGEELVCQNCGNRFFLDQLEKIQGGCNPVPITKEDKTETGQTIIIPREYLEENKVWFQYWGK